MPLKLNLNIPNKAVHAFIPFIVLLAVIGLVWAYNSSGTGGDPTVMGHSVDEMDWTKPLPGDLYVTGNIGIGTLTPTQKLDVVGKVRGTWLCIGADCRDAWPGSITTYVFYGSKDCPSGDTELYDGSVTAFVGINTSGDSVCADTDNVSDTEDLMLSYSWGLNKGSENTISCAVCQTPATVCFISYGSNSCPAGYIEKYDGYITGVDFYNHRTTLCVEESSLEDIFNPTFVYAWGDRKANTVSLGCSVCCR